jgi:hypothetical protein
VTKECAIKLGKASQNLLELEGIYVGAVKPFGFVMAMCEVKLRRGHHMHRRLRATEFELLFLLTNEDSINQGF